MITITKVRNSSKKCFSGRELCGFSSLPVAPRNIYKLNLQESCRNDRYFGILIAEMMYSIKMTRRCVEVKSSEISVPETSCFLMHKSPCDSLVRLQEHLVTDQHITHHFLKNWHQWNSNLNYLMLHADIGTSLSCHQPLRCMTMSSLYCNG